MSRKLSLASSSWNSHPPTCSPTFFPNGPSTSASAASTNYIGHGNFGSQTPCGQFILSQQELDSNGNSHRFPLSPLQTSQQNYDLQYPPTPSTTELTNAATASSIMSRQSSEAVENQVGGCKMLHVSSISNISDFNLCDESSYTQISSNCDENPFPLENFSVLRGVGGFGI